MALENLVSLINQSIVPFAVQTDESGVFPETSFAAIKDSGILGLISDKEVGGQGLGLREAAQVCETIAEHCASTAMIVCMHYSATVVLEKFGSREIREEIAAGKHLSTLAFSENGSRSHFWAPIGTAKRESTNIILDAHKSWVTSANFADSYVWSSKPINEEKPSSIFLVPRKSQGLRIERPFVGLGLRGNDSSPVIASNVSIPAENMLGGDGEGFDIMMGVVLPVFVTLSASVSIGIMKAAVNSSAAHVSLVKHTHLSQSIADLPTIRAYLARAKILLDSSIAFRNDTLSAIETGREDTMLRVLEVKAVSGENALQVCDLAMRVCGGAAFRKDVGVERNFRDSRAASVMAPTSDVLYDFIGKLVCNMPLF